MGTWKVADSPIVMSNVSVNETPMNNVRVPEPKPGVMYKGKVKNIVLSQCENLAPELGRSHLPKQGIYHLTQI